MTDLIHEESQNLERLAKFVEDMNSTNSTLDKVAKLANYTNDEYIRKALLYTYDSFKKYFITVEAIKKSKDKLDKNHVDSLFELLDSLDSRKYTGHAAIGMVNSFLTDHFMYEKLIHSIFDRNLKIRVDVAQINRLFGDMIPTFDVALAKSFKNEMTVADRKGKKKVDFEKEKWYASRKLDGVRCICIIDENGNVNFFSRAGNQFLTLDVIGKEIQKWGLTSVVFDGEMCIMDAAGNEDFSGIVKQINKKDHTIATPKYNMFDTLSLDEFRNKQGVVEFSVRIENLKSIIAAAEIQFGKSPNISVLTQGVIKDEEHLKKLVEIASKNGWEGVMLRKSVPYEGHRSSNMLKVKEMQDGEYVVLDVEYGEITTTFMKDGLTGEDVYYEDGNYFYVADDSEVKNCDFIERYSATRVMASNLIIEHKKNRVAVGSGLSMAQRQLWYKDKTLIIGKTVTIQYFQESEVDGRMSLRFPVLKYKYDDKRDV